MDRYHRQSLLPQIGPAGRARLAASRVVLVGVGALGTHIAEQLVRAGVGYLRIVDRDIVELTNLQRQVLFDETHAATGWPKAAAAAERLAAINSEVVVDARIADVHAGNIKEIIGEGFQISNLKFEISNPQSSPPSLLLDGTDNVTTRYLLNDFAVKHAIPWIYGACVGVEGRVMAVRPGESPCLRCIFPTPPRPEDLATCDTAGVLGSAAAVVASLQVVAAIRLLIAAPPQDELLSMNLWSSRFHRLPLTDARRPECPCCGLRQFEFLNRPPGESTATLCGRDAIQIRGERPVDLEEFDARWQPLGTVERNRFFIRCHLTDPVTIRLTLFADGRLIVQGTRDPARAKSLYARFVGA